MTICNRRVLAQLLLCASSLLCVTNANGQADAGVPAPAPGPAPANNDKDGDGVEDSADKCPDEAEDKDNVEDDDGCPENTDAEQAKKAADDAKQSALVAALIATAKDQSDADMRDRLIRSGLTVGLAGVVQFHVGYGSPAIAAMPYAMLVPGYLGGSDAENAACADRWVGAPIGDVRVSARKHANTDAEAIVSCIEAQFDAPGLGGSLENQQALAIANRCYYGGYDPTWVGHLKRYYMTRKAERDPAGRMLLRQRFVSAVSHGVVWAEPRDASCGWERVGIFVGYPIPYDADLTLPESDGARRSTTREFDSLFSAGLAWIPSSELSVLLGFSLGNVRQQEDADGNPGKRKIRGTVLFGLGGNLDLLGAAFNSL